jgi:hypothetical protein
MSDVDQKIIEGFARYTATQVFHGLQSPSELAGLLRRGHATTDILNALAEFLDPKGSTGAQLVFVNRDTGKPVQKFEKKNEWVRKARAVRRNMQGYPEGQFEAAVTQAVTESGWKRRNVIKVWNKIKDA